MAVIHLPFPYLHAVPPLSLADPTGQIRFWHFFSVGLICECAAQEKWLPRWKGDIFLDKGVVLIRRRVSTRFINFAHFCSGAVRVWVLDFFLFYVVNVGSVEWNKYEVFEWNDWMIYFRSSADKVHLWTCDFLMIYNRTVAFLVTGSYICVIYQKYASLFKFIIRIVFRNVLLNKRRVFKIVWERRYENELWEMNLLKYCIIYFDKY